VIKDAIEYLTDLRTANRDTVVKLDDGSGRIFIYEDQSSRYLELDRWPGRKRSVSNIESFTAMVLEEARRAQSDGDWMTVVFGVNGAQFVLDDRDQRTTFVYGRELSPQCALLLQSRAKPVEHRAFVSLLQRLRPSIREFPNVLRDFRKISFGSGVKVESEPTLCEGKRGNAYSLEVTVNSKATAAALPSTIECEIQYARGSLRRYPLTLDIDISLRDQPRALLFELNAADLETLAQQAIEDEIAGFREAVKSLPRLCVLEDY
jgi:hypothetical protein